MLKEAGVPMEKKNFAIGVRIEHDQQAVSRQQYGPAFSKLPPSDYKLGLPPAQRPVGFHLLCLPRWAGGGGRLPAGGRGH